MLQTMKAKLITAGTLIAGLAASGIAYATPIIANDTLDGLPATGTYISDFLKNIIPGVFAVMLLLGLAAGIVAIIMAVMRRIQGNFGGGRR